MTSSHTEKLATALQALALVDGLLAERGMRPDCSARHNLAIAHSNIIDVRDALSDGDHANGWDEFEKLLQAHEDATMAVAMYPVAPSDPEYQVRRDQMVATRRALHDFVQRLRRLRP